MKYLRCYLSCLAGFLLLMCLGMIISYPSPAFPNINSGNYGFKLSGNMMSWLASFAGLFAIPGSIIVVPLMDKYGRKLAIVMITLPLAIGWLLIVASFNVTILAIGRAILGVANGMEAVCVTVYLAEISPKRIRGRICVVAFIFLNFGGFLVNLLGAFVNWRWIALACLATVTSTSLATFFMYETPRWLIKQGNHREAAETMKLIWEMKDMQLMENEINDIDANLNLVSTLNYFQALTQLMKPPLWRPFVITQMLMMFQQFTGIAYINNYTVSIFQEATAGLQMSSTIFTNPHYQSCLFFIGSMIGNLMSMLVIDKLGRRVLLIFSGLVMTISLTAVGAYYYIQMVDESVTGRYLFWLPLTSLIIMVIGFSLSYGLIPSLLVNEMFAMNIRGVANGLVILNHNVFFIIIVKVLANDKSIPNYGIFWIFAGVTLVSVVFSFVFVPETKGRSLEEIQRQWYLSTANLTIKK